MIFSVRSFGTFERFRYTRTPNACGIYICDRDLTTATFLHLPSAAHTVLVAAESDEGTFLVVGGGGRGAQDSADEPRGNLA